MTTILSTPSGVATGPSTASVGCDVTVPLFFRNYVAGTLGANATFARSSSATIIDHEGVIRTVPSGAARFNGLRYVRNLCINAPDFSDWTINATYVGTRTLGITDPFGGNTAAIFDANLGTDGYIGPYPIYNVGASAKGIVSVFVRRISGSGYVKVRTPDNTNVIIYPTSEWQRFSCASDALGGNFYGQIIVQNGSSIAVACYQLENATGRTDTTTPSEYVSVGVLPAPYHGANVDGIKYFATENGNSVVSNVVTEGTGAAITGGYLLMEPAATNLVIYSGAFDNTAWEAAGAGPTRTIIANAAVSPDGTSSADRITAVNTSNSYAAISFTTIAADCTFSCYAKAGTANVFWLYTQSGSTEGLAYFDLSDQSTQAVAGSIRGPSNLIIEEVGNGWYRLSALWTALARSAPWGIGISDAKGSTAVTAGKTGYLWGAQLKVGTTPTSYIPTSGSAVTRAAETLSYSGAWTADNETRAITDAGTVDTDDWDGIVDATINGADNLAQITSIDVYTTGERPA